MIEIKEKKILLEKTGNGFENDGVFNPAVIQDNGKIIIYYRAVRTGNYSSIGYCELESPMVVKCRNERPLIFPEHDYESQGIEDPRITKVEDTYYLTYCAYDNTNALGALAISKDLHHFEKKGIITPRFTYREYKHLIECCTNLRDKYLFHYKIFKEHGLGPEVAHKLMVWDKNVMLFPKKIDDKFAMLHRIHPGIQLVLFDHWEDLTIEFWEDYFINLESHIVMDPMLRHESSHIGGGAPPIETEDGWLLIYHASESTPEGLTYHACAALLDLGNPLIEISRLHEPLISPTEDWEKSGVVNNIIFPTGTVVQNDDLYIYYGAADERVGVARVSKSELMSELKKQSKRMIK